METIEGPPPRPRAVTCMLSVTRSQTFFGSGMMAREMNLRLRPPPVCAYSELHLVLDRLVAATTHEPEIDAFERRRRRVGRPLLVSPGL